MIDMDRVLRLVRGATAAEGGQAARGSAYAHREAEDEKLIARLGAILTEADRRERARNHARRLAEPGFLRDVDDVDTVTVTVCTCGRPMMVTLMGNGKKMSMWLACCGNGQSARSFDVRVRSFTG